MAKRGRKKKRKFKLKKEIVGIILILICILGLGKLGIMGKVIDGILMFLFGYIGIYMMLISLLVIGFLLLFKDDFDFFSIRMIGFYIVFLMTFILLHQNFLKDGSSAMMIFNNTMNKLIESFKLMVSNGAVTDYFYLGGGLIGGLFGIGFLKLFSYTGMIIVSWVLLVIGLLFIGGSELFGSLKETFVDIKESITSEDDEEEEEKTPVIITGDNESNDNKIRITDISELTENKNIVKEATKEKHVTNANYQLPSLEILNKPKNKQNETNQAAVEKNIELLESVLKDFGISAKVVEVHIGPTVAQYELEIASGTRVNKITSINREIALALAKKDVRIEAPIPGKKTVGIEFANDNPVPVSFYEIMNTPQMANNFDNKLYVPLGKTIMGELGTCRIDKMPHLLIAGTTGSGKSVCVNGIICSILMRATPEEVKLAMVDPKVVELSGYNGIPHLMCPVVSDPKKASVLLQKMVQEMEDRYRKFGDTRTKNIETYNEYVEYHNRSHKDDPMEKLPFIVIIIDELADLMMVAAKEVEDSILRITQKARAAGMHLIVATQRPSTEVITGLIKANIPSRISFAVSNGIDSRTILDQTGAEKLLGKGDMLYLPIGTNAPTRIQGSFITDDEIKRIIEFVSSQQEASYEENLMNLDSLNVSTNNATGEVSQSEDVDPLYGEVVNFVVTTQKASASLIQRKFKVGYNRAGRLIDELEEKGIIGPQNGSKPRDVLVTLDNTSSEDNSNDDVLDGLEES